MKRALIHLLAIATAMEFTGQGKVYAAEKPKKAPRVDGMGKYLVGSRRTYRTIQPPSFGLWGKQNKRRKVLRSKALGQSRSSKT